MAASVTVLMPTYNARAHVDEQIASILSSPLLARLVILDDCSKDDTWAYLQQRYAGNPLIDLHQNEKNLGVIRTFEKLLGYVQTDYFMFADHDDVWLPSKIERSIRKLEETQALLVYTDLAVTDERLNILHPSKWVYSNTPPFDDPDPLLYILKNPVTGCTVAARRELIPMVTPFPADIPMHDRWLAVVAAAQGSIAYVAEPLMLYRQHGRNDTGGYPFGVRGLVKRVKKDSRGSLSGYLGNRARKRLGLIKGLEDRGYSSARLEKMKAVYSAGNVQRVVLLAGYAAAVWDCRDKLGAKNVVAEIFMTALPRKV